MSKPTHENIVEFKVYGEDALFSDVLTRTGMEAFTGSRQLSGTLMLYGS